MPANDGGLALNTGGIFRLHPESTAPSVPAGRNCARRPLPRRPPPRNRTAQRRDRGRAGGGVIVDSPRKHTWVTVGAYRDFNTCRKGVRPGDGGGQRIKNTVSPGV